MCTRFNKKKGWKIHVSDVGKDHERQPSGERYGGLLRRLFYFQNPDGFNCLDEICYKFDLEKPMWLDATVQDFKYHDKARFTQDNFIETVDFDYLEIQVIEE